MGVVMGVVQGQGKIPGKKRPALFLETQSQGQWGVAQNMKCPRTAIYYTTLIDDSLKTWRALDGRPC